jgi:hypothetical protein
VRIETLNDLRGLLDIVSFDKLARPCPLLVPHAALDLGNEHSDPPFCGIAQSIRTLALVWADG